MATAKKYTPNTASMSRQSRNNAYAAININWQQMRPDLRFEPADVIRDERLAWIANFLGLKKLDSTTELSDKQIGLLLDEMRRMTGRAPKQTAAPLTDTNVVQFPNQQRRTTELGDAEVVHLAGEAQIFTINKIVGFIGWSEEHFREFLFNRFRRRSPRLLKFKECNSLMMILINIAADKDLRALGKAKISRAMTAAHIPEIKRKLEIDR